MNIEPNLPAPGRLRILVGSITIFCAISLLFLLTPSSSAQSMFANLSGTVTDNTGAVIPGAKVIIQDINSKIPRTVTTNTSGYFSVSELPAGTYSVTAEVKGFRKWTATGVILQSSDEKNINISLAIGSESETVEVIAAAGDVALVDSGEKSANLSAKEIQDLSLVGRNAIELLKVLPGFTMSANSGLNKPAYSGQVVGINGYCVGTGCNAGGVGGNLMNGQLMTVNQDGQNTIDPGAYGTASPVNTNPESISEVKVLSSNFTAENAQGPVVVNATTKSGGSIFHGGAWLYARNSALNANEALYKDPSYLQPKPGESYYYPGAKIGGPVIIPGTSFNKSRQKLFFFEMFEAYRQKLDGGVDRAFIPTPDMLNGDFSFLNTYTFTYNHDPAVYAVPTTPDSATWLGMAKRQGCQITNAVMNAACIDPNAQLLLRAFLPSTGFVDPTTHNGFNWIQGFSNVPQNSWQNITREDINISDTTKAYFTWSRQRETADMVTGLWVGAQDWAVPTPSPVQGMNGSDSLTASLLKIISPTMTSETTFGYTWVNFPTKPTDLNKYLRSKVGYNSTGVFGDSNLPAVLSWNGSIASMGDVGHDYHPDMMAVKAIPSVKTNLTKVIRTHTTKYGFFYQHLYNKQDNWGQYMGVYQYNPIWWGGTSATGNQYADALMGINASYYEQALPPPSNIAQNIYAFYAQDDWKLNRRITLQAGLRFEHYAKPYNPDLGLAIFDPLKYNNGAGTNPGVSWHATNSGVPLSGADSRMFYYSPRVGAAIDVFGTGKTIVRGGWGKYRAYDSVQSNNYTAPAQTALGAVSWSCGNNDPLCPTWEDVDSHAYTPVLGHPVLNGTSFSAVFPRNDEQPLVTSYSLTINQQLPSKFNLELSYVGNNTNYQQGQPNINSIPVGAMTNAMSEHPADCTAGGTDNRTATACENHYRPYLAYQTINESVTWGKAQYDSFQASIRRSVGILTLQGNYTFGKAIGDNGQSVTPIGAYDDYGRDALYGILPFDRAHAFSASYVIDIPKIHSGNALLRGAANGWQISGITIVETGSQITANSNSQFGLNNSATLAMQLFGTPDLPAYPAYTCNPAKGLTSGRYINPNCITVPTASHPASGRTPYLAGPMYWNTDLTLAKTFRIEDRHEVQFRFAMFNPFNHSLSSFTSADGNAKISGFDSSGRPTNATDTQHTCPGPQCTAIGYTNYHMGHRVLELGVRYTF
ncbi:MAG TPA: carboxypeptidase regulatory-like domain-containing protein [Candidatus Binatia bacterium]|nr:carboxypeptidase regulatory-like domain-containing protein [Candidatus Binatia bacterium]